VRFAALFAAAWSALALAQDVASNSPPPAPDVSSGLPKVSAEAKVVTGKFGKPSAGDIILLSVKVTPEQGEGAEIASAEKLKQEPVEWGEGRILWWKPFDAATGAIVVGLTTYKPGKYEIKPLVFNKAGAPSFATQPVTVEFSSVGGDKSKDDIYPPVGAVVPLWVWILLGLLALALVLGALWWLKRWNERRKARIEELARAPKVLNPLEEFEKRRREIEARGLIDKGDYKPHYFGLSDAAKRFLGRAYRFDAEERTTRELVRELETLGMADSTVDEWEKIFDEMDVVKFTDQIPASDVARGIASRLGGLVTVSYTTSPVAREEALKRMAASQSRSGAEATR
jgi:hypothetical protein